MVGIQVKNNNILSLTKFQTGIIIIHMRNYIRHPADIPIEIHHLAQAAPREQRLKNISIGGLSLQADQYIEKGTIIDIKIPVSQPPFETKARVVWCRKKGNQFDIGVEFDEEKEAFRTRMVEQVCHIQHYKKEIAEREGRILDGREAAREWIAKFAKDFPGNDNKN
ncbi:MAG: PilZ domain-containing protein [bacterium]|nr:PilZ domain-containing protein [bacterium]MDD5353955.1 PilZ domain-containing protein [bacterium]MDD5756220.1 PilZ domain-containing protein [bacterium]